MKLHLFMKINFKRLFLSILIVYLLLVLGVFLFTNIIIIGTSPTSTADFNFLETFVAYPLVLIMQIPALMYIPFGGFPSDRSLLIEYCYIVCVPNLLGWLLILAVCILPIWFVYFLLSKLSKN